MKPLHIRLPASLKAWLTGQAERDGVTLAAFVREILADYRREAMR